MDYGKRVYLAGPMRGKKWFNFPAFDDAQEYLEGLGFDVVSPAQLDRAIGFDPRNLPEDHDWTDLGIIGFSLRDAVRRDLSAIIECDAIYLLKGWENSMGAKAEKSVADWLGLEIMSQD